MEMLYLVGEPLIKIKPEKDDFFMPVGQINVCRRVLEESLDPKVVVENLRQEYIAVVYSLKQMVDIDFRLVYAHPEEIDKSLLAVCIQRVGCRLMGFGPHFFPSAVAYPRDFCTVLPKLLLLSSNAIKEVTAGEKNGWKLLVSPYGEGGRVLVQDDTMVVCEKLVAKEGESISGSAELEKIRNFGVRIGFFPSILNARFSLSQKDAKSLFSNDHIDRGACLLKGKNGKLFLVVDPKIVTADWTKPKGPSPWTARSPAETKAYLRQNLGPMGIEVCWPESITVPYALNLLQFPDGRVLMTGGDSAVKAVVDSIVGNENVIETPVPIQFYPVWLYAGIRCLVSEAPMPIIKPL